MDISEAARQLNKLGQQTRSNFSPERKREIALKGIETKKRLYGDNFINDQMAKLRGLRGSKNKV